MFKKYVFLNISGGYLKGGRLLSLVVASYMAEPTSYSFSMIGMYESSLFRFRLNYQVEQLEDTFIHFHLLSSRGSAMVCGFECSNLFVDWDGWTSVC